MRFDERFLDEVKSRLRLSDVIGRTVKLRRSGREYVGLSPFAKEKTPSFYVNDEKGFFHDFSSGKHGDLISFLQETERLTFPEAVERLAAEAGVPMPAVDPRTAQPEDQWARFGLGYAPTGRTALKDYLVAKGAKPAELVEAGLLIAPEDGGAPYDRFRDRIMFPITDGRGRAISFGGRALDPEARAKYLNGPETSLFHKGLTLYGLPEARRLLHAGQAGGGQGTPLVVVEGYMDVLACQRAEIPAAAPLGTALTEEQMELLWRLHPEPTLCFDADKAGARAASRAIDRALPKLKPGRSFKFTILSGGKDPDDVLREQGAAALKAQVADTRPFVTALFERERDLEPLDTPERRAGLKSRLRQAAASIEDKDLAQAYRDELFARFDELFQRPAPAAGRGPGFRPPARAPGRKGRWNEPAYVTAPSTPEGVAGAKSLHRAVQPVAAAVAQGALDNPAWLEDHLEVMETHGFGDPALKELASEIIRLRLGIEDEGAALDTQGLVRHLADLGYGSLMAEITKAARKSGAPFLLLAQTSHVAQAQWTQAFEVLTRVAALDNALSAAKADAARGLDAPSFSRLKSERDALKRAIKTGTVWAGEPS
jgi:DNA primase